MAQRIGEKSGAVKKLGKQEAWKDRFILLKDGKLNYFRDDHDMKNPKHVFELFECHVTISPDDEYLKVTGPDRVITLKGASLAETGAWYRALRCTGQIENYIKEEAIHPPPIGLPRIVGKTTFAIDHELVTYDMISELWYPLKENTVITEVALTHGAIGDALVELVMSTVLRAHALKSLDLSHNRIGDGGVGTICEALFVDISLTDLDISHNGFGDDGAMRLAEAIRVNPTLRHVRVGYNEIGPNGAAALLQATEKAELETLVLDGNPISSDWKLVFDALKSAKLGMIGLGNVSLGTKNGAKLLAEVVGQNTNVKAYDLSDNTFDEVTLDEAFAKSTVTSVNWGTMTSLKLQHMCDNGFVVTKAHVSNE